MLSRLQMNYENGNDIVNNTTVGVIYFTVIYGALMSPVTDMTGTKIKHV